MNQLMDSLRELLAKYDNETGSFSEIDVSQAIRALRDAKEQSEPPMQWLAEVMAFDFCEDYQNRETGWGTYYGPMVVLNNKDGTCTESPSIKKVSGGIIQYWSERATVARHPILRARYADLVWDFTKVVLGTSPPYTMAQTVIDSILDIAHRNCHRHEIDVVTKLKRALSLVLALNDASRIEVVRDAIIIYEDRIVQDSKPGLWGFSYDLLFDNKRVILSDEQKRKLIDDLESRLKRVATPNKPEDTDPWAAEAAALRLANHYRVLGQALEIRRVLLEFGHAFEQVSANASALQASAWLQRVHGVYVQYGLNDEAESIAIKLQQIGPRMASEMKQLSHTMEVPKEKLDKYIAALTAGNLDDIFSRVAAHYIPRKTAVENQLRDLAQKHPVSFLFSTELQDSHGRSIATVGPLDADLTGNIVKQMSQNMSISALFMREVLESLCGKFPACEDSMSEYVFRSPVFDQSRRAIVEMGVKAHFRGEYAVAVHLLIPQIEEAIRCLLEKVGGSILKPARGGGLRLKILDELLREPMIVDVFGEDTVFYFRVLLTDQRGWNLRNSVCHGLCRAEEFGAVMADRILHVLLCLAQIREDKSMGH